MQIIVGRSIQNQIAAGPLHFYTRHFFPLASVSHRSQDEEIHRFRAAQQRSIVMLSKLYEQAARDVGIQAASIFSIHAMLLEDTSFVESILSVLSNQHTTAEYAVQTAGNSFATAFADMDSPYMQARGADIRDISNHLSAVCWIFSPLILLVTSLPFWFPTSCYPVKYWHWTGASCWAWSPGTAAWTATPPCFFGL